MTTAGEITKNTQTGGRSTFRGGEASHAADPSLTVSPHGFNRTQAHVGQDAAAHTSSTSFTTGFNKPLRLQESAFQHIFHVITVAKRLVTGGNLKLQFWI